MGTPNPAVGRPGTMLHEVFRPPDERGEFVDPARPYVQSYLVTRTVVGIVGIALPVVLLVVEIFMSGSPHLRGSLSAYYHTPARDVFVGALSMVGILLMTYLSGSPRSWGFRLSLVAGVAVLLVAMVPTSRIGLAPDAPRCGPGADLPGCAPVQQWLGETLAATIHFTCAVIFIVSLALISFSFARERGYRQSPAMTTFQYLCGVLIIVVVLAVAVSELVGFDGIGELTPLYLGEVAAVLLFGAAWLAKGMSLREMLTLPTRPRPAAGGGPNRSDGEIAVGAD